MGLKREEHPLQTRELPYVSGNIAGIGWPVTFAFLGEGTKKPEAIPQVFHVVYQSLFGK